MTLSAARKIKQYDQKAQPAMRVAGKERDEFITRYAPLIRTVAGRLAMRLPSHIDQDDLMSAGIMGLLDAMEKYDPTKGVAFKSYAESRIRGAMLDELRSMDWVPRSVRKNARRLDTAYGAVERRKMQPATDEEVAQELNIDLESFYRMLDETRGVSLFNEEDIGELMAHKKVGTLWEVFQGSTGFDPIAELDLAELKQVVATAIDALSENERLVISLYYYEDLTMKEIGEVIGYTESRISQLHSKALARLRHKVRGYFNISRPEG
jgi:RNA polymerase sigma factor for flagellar operon FliA